MDFTSHDIGVAAMRFERAMIQVVGDALVDHALTPSEYGVLDHIHTNPGASNSDLARYLLVTPQSLGRLTKRLTDRELILPDVGGPGRRRPITSTPEGDALYKRARLDVEQALATLFITLDSDDKRRLRRMLGLVADAAER